MIRVKTPEIQSSTDASSSVWGGIVLNSNNIELIGMSASGMWSRMISHKPSNYCELLTIIVTLESFSDQLQDKHFQILSDNISAVAYLNLVRGQSSGLATPSQSL